MKTTFKISGMTCSGCKVTVENKLSSLDKVEDVEVNLENGEAIIYSKYPIKFSILSFHDDDTHFYNMCSWKQYV